MINKNLTTLAASLMLCFGVAQSASAYTADGRTITGGDINTTTARLFSSVGVLAPVQSVVWWVADTGNNGVNLNPLSGAAVLGADDVLILADSIDGTLFGSNPGKYIRGGISVADNLATAPIYFYLWNSVSATPSSFTPQNGNTFGVYNVGVVTPPPVGNAFWGVNGDVLGNTYVVGVPEPSTYLLGGMGMIGMLALRFRKRQ